MTKRLWQRWIAAATVAFVMNGCGGGTSSDESHASSASGANFSQLETIPVGESLLLNIPTYDGSGQVVHPDVIANNGRFVMTITPYAFSDVDLENPSIYVSSDGLNFQPPEGTANPLIYNPPNGYNDDPDLVFDPRSGTYYIYYNETPSDYDKQYLDLLESPDLVSWTHLRLAEFRTNAKEPFIVSPAIVIAYGTYFMFHVEIDTDAANHSPNVCKNDPHKHQIRVMFSSDGIGWDKHKDEGIDIDMPSDFNPWHLNIVEGNGRYYMLVNGYRRGFCDRHNLYLAISDDLAHWHFIPQPIVTAGKDFYNSKIIYRSAALINGDDMYVYFSFYTYDHRWLLGVKRISLSALGG